MVMLPSVVSFSAPETKARSPFLETLERRQSEENAIVHSLFTYFGNKLLLEDKELFSRAVDEVFAHSVLMSVSTEGDSQLVEEVKEHLQSNGLQVRQELISKVCFCFSAYFWQMYAPSRKLAFFFWPRGVEKRRQALIAFFPRRGWGRKTPRSRQGPKGKKIFFFFILLL